MKAPAPRRIGKQASDAIQRAALRRLGSRRSRDCILYIDERWLPPDTWLGPRHAGVPVRWPQATLVFVDEEPAAGFAHACRYLLFDPVTARFLSEHPARFPPYPQAWPETFRRFGPRREDRPRRTGSPAPARNRDGMRTSAPAPLNPHRRPQLAMGQGGRRLAVLFAGTPDPSTVNTMELGYRTLIGPLRYRARDIRVANHHGEEQPTCAKWKRQEVSPVWAGDGTGFTMRVDHPGTPRGFRAALECLAPTTQDSLFILTSGHGENDARGSYLATAFDSRYYARQFKADLQNLKVGELVVVMQQCFSGGFRYAVKTSNAAPRIAFASAAAWNTRAYNDRDDDCDFAWNSFARDWFAAQSGCYYDDEPLSTDPDAPPAGNADAHISAVEAFRYARETAHCLDRPQDAYRPQAVQASRQLRLDGSH